MGRNAPYVALKSFLLCRGMYDFFCDFEAGVLIRENRPELQQIRSHL